MRQLAAAQLMVASNKYSQKFAYALLAGTSSEMLVSPPARSTGRSLNAEQRARLIVETDNLLTNLKSVEASYGVEALTLSVCSRYVARLLSNDKVLALLTERHPHVSGELRSLVSAFTQESASLR